MERIRHAIAASAGAALLAACGGEDEAPELSDAERANIIENIAVARPEKEVEPQPPALQPLSAAEVAALPPGPKCGFTSGGQLVFAGGGARGIARVDGTLVSLPATGPAGATGGFYSDGRISVSVGQPNTAVLGRLTLTDRAREKKGEAEIRGTWSCGDQPRSRT